MRLKNARVAGNYFDSDQEDRPISDGKQQVWGSSFRKNSQLFFVKKRSQGQLVGTFKPDDPVRVVRNGDLVRLLHGVSKHHLHCENQSAQMTPQHFQVSVFGEVIIAGEFDRL